MVRYNVILLDYTGHMVTLKQVVYSLETLKYRVRKK